MADDTPDDHLVPDLIDASSSITGSLAARFGIHRATVCALLEREGAPRRYRKLGHDAVDQAVRSYASGSTLEEISQELDVHPSTVYRALKKAGDYTSGLPRSAEVASRPSDRLYNVGVL